MQKKYGILLGIVYLLGAQTVFGGDRQYNNPSLSAEDYHRYGTPQGFRRQLELTGQQQRQAGLPQPRQQEIMTVEKAASILLSYKYGRRN